MRPYTRDPSSNKFWKDTAIEKFGLLNQQVSLNHYFNHYVKDKKEIPSENKFIVYIEEKQLNKAAINSKKDTLPQRISNDVEQLFESYRSAFIEMFSVISLEDLYKIIDIVTIEEKERTSYKSEIEVNYTKAREIYDTKKVFDLADMPVDLFNRLSECSLTSIKREDIETVYFEVIKANEKSKIEKSEPSQIKTGFFHRGFNSKTMEIESVQLRNSR